MSGPLAAVVTHAAGVTPRGVRCGLRGRCAWSSTDVEKVDCIKCLRNLASAGIPMLSRKAKERLTVHGTREGDWAWRLGGRS